MMIVGAINENGKKCIINSILNYMKKSRYIISMVLLSILLLLTMPYAVKIFGIILFPNRIGVLRQLSIYQWVGVGIAVFAVIHAFVKKNMTWLETFSHELTHIVVALLFFRRIHSFQAEEGSGVVYTSGTHAYALAPMALAPYCLPIFTYLLLSIRCLIDSHGIWIYDVLIGMSICFHFFCFKLQIGNYQTDINQYPLSFSYLYIVTALLINICVIWVAFFPQYNVYTSLGRLVTSVWENGEYVVKYLFRN